MARGTLSAGDRLPTHRKLAARLGVTVGTVSRAYAEAERRGLTVGEVGRGTFVAGSGSSSGEDHGWGPPGSPEWIDMSLSLPPALPGGAEADALSRAVAKLSRKPGFSEQVSHWPSQRQKDAVTAAGQWLRGANLLAPDHELQVTAGAQHATLVALSALLKPGDVCLTAALTYPGVKAVARLLQLRLGPLEVDDEGIVPESLEEACRQEPRPRALYLVPTIQNPTGGVLSDGRRDRIAELCAIHDLWLIEDDIHAVGLEEPPLPLANRIPDRAVYIASLGKTLGPSLRLAYTGVPPRLTERFASGVRSTIWQVPPLMPAVVAQWIQDGTAEMILRERREEVRRRQALASRWLALYGAVGHPDGLFVWLPLPPPWRSDDFVLQAEQRGVQVAGAGAFAVGRNPVPHAVRLALGSTTSGGLEVGLERIQDILEGGLDPCTSIV